MARRAQKTAAPNHRRDADADLQLGLDTEAASLCPLRITG